MAETNVSQEGSLSKAELERDLMVLAKRMDQEGLEYLIRMARREILWKKKGAPGREILKERGDQ